MRDALFQVSIGLWQSFTYIFVLLFEEYATIIKNNPLQF